MRLFISYRRAKPDMGLATAVQERLRSALRGWEVFFDVIDLPPPTPFPETIRRAVRRSDVMLVLIGPGWLETRSRLDRPEDWIRQELELALKQGGNIVPVLLEGVAMPRPEALPESIRSLTSRQALHVAQATFDRDLREVVRILDGLGRKTTKGRVRRAIRIAALLGLVAGAVGGGVWAWDQDPPLPPRAPELSLTWDSLPEAYDGRCPTNLVWTAKLALREAPSPIRVRFRWRSNVPGREEGPIMERTLPGTVITRFPASISHPAGSTKAYWAQPEILSPDGPVLPSNPTRVRCAEPQELKVEWFLRQGGGKWVPMRQEPIDANCLGKVDVRARLKVSGGSKNGSMGVVYRWQRTAMGKVKRVTVDNGGSLDRDYLNIPLVYLPRGVPQPVRVKLHVRKPASQRGTHEGAFLVRCK